MIEKHRELLYQRLRKTARHLGPRFRREGIEAYCLYDWDIPELRVKVDRYADHLVIAEYERQQTRDLEGYLDALGDAAASALGLPPQNVHKKQRRTRQRGSAAGRYERLGEAGLSLLVSERDLRFEVNLDDFVDTGLFSDHRDTRARLRALAPKSFLNLYAYTGAFSVALAKSGARTVSVDLSRRYLDWAKRNFAHSGLDPEGHEFVETEATSYLRAAAVRGERFEVVFVDPPSFSTTGGLGSAEFDVQRDHHALLQLALALVEPEGALYFSTNHQRFVPDLDGFEADGVFVEDLTERTTPLDYRGRAARMGPPHRLYRLLKTSGSRAPRTAPSRS